LGPQPTIQGPRPQSKLLQIIKQERIIKSQVKNPNTIFDVIAASVVLTCILATGSAFAGGPSEGAPSETVKFGELNLDAPSGVSTLYQRIHAAAQRVCGPESRDLARLQQRKTCINEAETNAVKQVNVGALTAYFEMKTGRSALKLAASSAE
jgi:UrcA family protein